MVEMSGHNLIFQSLTEISELTFFIATPLEQNKKNAKAERWKVKNWNDGTSALSWDDMHICMLHIC